MANVGPNQGRRLRLALSRFAAMLIEEAQSISGLSYTQLDEKLGLPDGQAFRYSRYPVDEKDPSAPGGIDPATGESSRRAPEASCAQGGGGK